MRSSSPSIVSWDVVAVSVVCPFGQPTQPTGVRKKPGIPWQGRQLLLLCVLHQFLREGRRIEPKLQSSGPLQFKVAWVADDRVSSILEGHASVATENPDSE